MLKEKGFMLSLIVVFFTFAVFNLRTIQADVLDNFYFSNYESGYVTYGRAKKTARSKQKKDLGFRVGVDLGFPYFFGNNKSMIKLWQGMRVPSSSNDTLEWLNLMIDINATLRIYHKMALGVFYSQYGPELIKNITYYYYSGYYLYYNGILYPVSSGTHTDTYFLSFNNSEHIGLLLRYYVSPFDIRNRTTWSYGTEAFAELGVGETFLHGSFSTNYNLNTTFSGSSIPYMHLGFFMRGKLRYLPAYWSINVMVNTSVVKEIRDSNGNIVYTLDGKKLSVDFTSFSFGGGLGIAF